MVSIILYRCSCHCTHPCISICHSGKIHSLTNIPNTVETNYRDHKAWDRIILYSWWFWVFSHKTINYCSQLQEAVIFHALFSNIWGSWTACVMMTALPKFTVCVCVYSMCALMHHGICSCILTIALLRDALPSCYCSACIFRPVQSEQTVMSLMLFLKSVNCEVVNFVFTQWRHKYQLEK